MSATELSLVAYGTRAGRSSAPSLLNSMFMSTVNAAAKTLVSVAAKERGGGAIVRSGAKWRPRDHLRFMMMMMTWMTLWVLRTLMDHIPSCSSLAPLGLLRSLSRFGGLIELPGSRPSGSASLASASASVSSLQMILEEGVEAVPTQALGRALSHILALLNDIPATSRKYQFSMAMAERIMDGNARSGSDEMLEVNRIALSSAFDRTSSLFQRSLEKRRSGKEYGRGGYAWAVRAVRALPLGSYVAPYMKGLGVCVGAVRSLIDTVRSPGKTRRLALAAAAGVGEGGWCGGRVAWDDEEGCEVMTEKLAEELLWITGKLRVYGAVDEALEQWSYASGLASVSLNTDPRLQGLIVKISAMLFSDLNREEVTVDRDVKFRLLVLWLPLFCHAGNGLAYPVLTYFEKGEVERAIDEAIWSLPPVDQEVILTTWMQDYAVSASDWPNLQGPYDRWCQSTRSLVAEY